jgi:hypothetical protein
MFTVLCRIYERMYYDLAVIQGTKDVDARANHQEHPQCIGITSVLGPGA